MSQHGVRELPHQSYSKISVASRNEFKVLQAFKDSQRTKSETLAEDRKVRVEEDLGPAQLREEEEKSFKDDEQTIDDRPEYTGRLVGYGTIPVKEMRSVKMQSKQSAP